MLTANQESVEDVSITNFLENSCPYCQSTKTFIDNSLFPNQYLLVCSSCHNIFESVNELPFWVDFVLGLPSKVFQIQPSCDLPDMQDVQNEGLNELMGQFSEDEEKLSVGYFVSDAVPISLPYLVDVENIDPVTNKVFQHFDMFSQKASQSLSLPSRFELGDALLTPQCTRVLILGSSIVADAQHFLGFQFNHFKFICKTLFASIGLWNRTKPRNMLDSVTITSIVSALIKATETNQTDTIQKLFHIDQMQLDSIVSLFADKAVATATYGDEVVMTKATQDMIALIPSACKTVGLPEESVPHVVAFAKNLHARLSSSRRINSGTYGACALYIIARSERVKAPQKTVGNIFQVSSMTIRKTIKECLKPIILECWPDNYMVLPRVKGLVVPPYFRVKSAEPKEEATDMPAFLMPIGEHTQQSEMDELTDRIGSPRDM
ncbi:hypothetical protein PCE1_003793 [Barthelona sp. PCE]